MVNYRVNVAALIINEVGNLLICQRSSIPGAWQFPQGGVDLGETTEEGLFREVSEEIGLLPQHYDVLESRKGYRYLYPPEVRARKVKKHGNHGQDQTYFLCKIKHDAPPINVHQSTPEFSAYRWILPEEFDLDWVPAFKHDVYRAVLKDFFGVDLAPAT